MKLLFAIMLVCAGCTYQTVDGPVSDNDSGIEGSYPYIDSAQNDSSDSRDSEVCMVSCYPDEYQGCLTDKCGPAIGNGAVCQHDEMYTCAGYAKQVCYCACNVGNPQNPSTDASGC